MTADAIRTFPNDTTVQGNVWAMSGLGFDQTWEEQSR
jgi:hypothetical protein